MNNGVFRARQLPNCFQGQPNAANFLGGKKGLLDGQLNIASFYRAETAKKGLATSAHWRRCAETNFDNYAHHGFGKDDRCLSLCLVYAQGP